MRQLPSPEVELTLAAGLPTTSALCPPALQLLEHVDIMTVSGYLIAESRGRIDVIGDCIPLTVVLLISALALLFELLQGLRANVDTSVVRLMLALSGGLYGAWTHRLQLVLVRRQTAHNQANSRS